MTPPIRPEEKLPLHPLCMKKKKKKMQDASLPHQDTHHLHTRNTLKKTTSSNQLPLLPLATLILISLIEHVNCVAVHEVRFIATKSGRTDYALTNETIELSCHYLMKDDLEDIKQLVWSKDGQNFLRWRKGEPGMRVLSYTFKGHIDNSSTNHHIIIHNVTIEMHGKYRCSIRTDLGMDESEQNVVVITQPACRLGDWRIRTNPSQCRETLLLDCRNMFPKPAPSCGLWNSKLEKTIMGLSVDVSEEPEPPSPGAVKRQQTYRVRYVQQFDLLPWPQQQQQHSNQLVANRNSSSSGSSSGSQNEAKPKNKPISPAYLLQFAGHLWFKCDIVVPETGWRISLVHKMFDYSDACLQDPLEAVARWRLNYSQQQYAFNHQMQLQQQQAGYLLDKQIVDQADYELLSSNLKYELLPAANAKQVELNCWRKPKLGTLAKLSCMNKFSHEHQHHHHQHRISQLVRLRGASLMQCGEFGWFPVKGSNIVNKLNDSRLLGGRKILKQRSSGDTTTNTTSTTNTTTKTTPIVYDNNNNNSNNNNVVDSLERRAKIPHKTRTQAAAAAAEDESAALTYIQTMDSNDLDDDNSGEGLAQTPTTTAATATTTTTNHGGGGVGVEDHESLDIIPAEETEGARGDRDRSQQDINLQHSISHSHSQALDPLLSMQPQELAALLPTCVSPRARHQQQHRGPPNPDRQLPLHDDGRPMQILDSSSSTPKSRPSAFDLGSLFNFYSSSSASESAIIVSHYRAAPTMVCCLIAALFFIMTTATIRLSH